MNRCVCLLAFALLSCLAVGCPPLPTSARKGETHPAVSPPSTMAALLPAAPPPATEPDPKPAEKPKPTPTWGSPVPTKTPQDVADWIASTTAEYRGTVGNEITQEKANRAIPLHWQNLVGQKVAWQLFLGNVAFAPDKKSALLHFNLSRSAPLGVVPSSGWQMLSLEPVKVSLEDAETFKATSLVDFDGIIADATVDTFMGNFSIAKFRLTLRYPKP